MINSVDKQSERIRLIPILSDIMNPIRVGIALYQQMGNQYYNYIAENDTQDEGNAPLDCFLNHYISPILSELNALKTVRDFSLQDALHKSQPYYKALFSYVNNFLALGVINRIAAINTIREEPCYVHFMKKIGKFKKTISEEYLSGSPYVEGLIAHTGALSEDASDLVRGFKPPVKFKKF